MQGRLSMNNVRDDFAKAAMQGILGGYHHPPDTWDTTQWKEDYGNRLAEASYLIADAFMEVRGVDYSKISDWPGFNIVRKQGQPFSDDELANECGA